MPPLRMTSTRSEDLREGKERRSRWSPYHYKKKQNTVHLKLRGSPPPPNDAMGPRDALCHGVEALRMIPAGGEGEIVGRTGLLAHSYMLGPNGDSNGCVSFRNYDAFLRAYKQGKVRRLVVVASGGRAMLASSN